KVHVGPLEIIEAVEARQPEIAAQLDDYSRNVDEAERLTGHERKVGRDVGRPLVFGLLHRKIEAELRGVESARSESALVFERQILIARTLFGEGDRRFVERMAIHVAPVECVSPPHLVAASDLVINPPLREMFISRLREREEILSGPGQHAFSILEQSSIQAREEKI